MSFVSSEAIIPSVSSGMSPQGYQDFIGNQILTSIFEKQGIEFDAKSYYDIFRSNYIALLSPNRSYSEAYQVLIKSENSSRFQGDENISIQLDCIKDHFVRMLINKSQDEDDDEAYDLLCNLLSLGHRSSVLFWIQSIFNKNCEDERIVVGLLKLFLDFEYDALTPTAETIAACCKNHKSYRVKSATFSLLGYWCNKQALTIINAFEEPQELLLREKYNKLKSIISAKCSF